MTFPTAVNDQITDAVTQANVKVLGDAPAQALSALVQGPAMQGPATSAEAVDRPKSQPHIWLCE